MANSTKDNQLSSSGSCALYYFPEIPGNLETCKESAPTHGHFVSDARDRHDDRTPSGGQSQDKEQIQERIDAAFNEGVKKGRTETIAAQQEKIENAVAALKTAVSEMIRIRHQDVDRMETETIRLALAIAKKVIGYETEHGPVIGHVIKNAMKKVVDPRQLTLKLNPKDVDAVDGIKQELLMADDFDAVLRMETDEAIGRGGCIIETKLGDVDARIDQQVRILEDLLNDQLPKPVVES